MPKAGIAVVVFFLGMAVAQFIGVFESETGPPASVEATPNPSPEPTETEPLKPFPKFEGPKPKAQAYETTEELTTALADKGIECTSLSPLEHGDPTLEDFQLCDVGAAERRFDIYLLPRASNRKFWINNMKDQELPLPIVYGPNWIIVGAGDPGTALKRVEAVAGAIGGKVRDFSPKGKKKG